MEEKVLVFDMDGTIADLYGIDGWLEMLENENPTPYIMAKPMYDFTQLQIFTWLLGGCKIVVTSWLAKDSSEEFKEVVRTAKKDWLDRHHFPYDELHFVQYGTTKANCTRKYGKNQILFDDNEKICKGWSLGRAYTPTKERNILDIICEIAMEQKEEFE